MATPSDIPADNGKKVGKGRPPVEHQFKPGHKPPGRPKGSVSIVTALKKRLAEEGQLDSVVDSVMEQARLGNAQVLKMLLDRVDGPVMEIIDQTTRVRVEWDDEVKPYAGTDSEATEASCLAAEDSF